MGSVSYVIIFFQIELIQTVGHVSSLVKANIILFVRPIYNMTYGTVLYWSVYIVLDHRIDTRALNFKDVIHVC